MPSGFETLNDDNESYQITDDMKFMSLLAKGNSSAITNWTVEQDMDTSYEGVLRIELAGRPIMNPLIALHCPTAGVWAGAKIIYGNTVEFYIYRLGNAAFDWYVYSDTRPLEPSSAGIALYDQSGEIVFSSDYPPIKILGINTGGVYSGRPIAGKKLAFIPAKMRRVTNWTHNFASLGSCQQGSGQPGYVRYDRFEYSRTALRCGTGEFSFDPRYRATSAIPVGCSGTNFLPDNINDSGVYVAIMIDVTNI